MCRISRNRRRGAAWLAPSRTKYGGGTVCVSDDECDDGGAWQRPCIPRRGAALCANEWGRQRTSTRRTMGMAERKRWANLFSELVTAARLPVDSFAHTTLSSLRASTRPPYCSSSTQPKACFCVFSYGCAGLFRRSKTAPIMARSDVRAPHDNPAQTNVLAHLMLLVRGPSDDSGS